MTNTTEHYKWAKIELGRAEAIANSDSGAWDTGPTGRHGYVMQAVAMAQVHATLAVAQAISEGTIGATLAALDSRLRGIES